MRLYVNHLLNNFMYLALRGPVGTTMNFITQIKSLREEPLVFGDELSFIAQWTCTFSQVSTICPFLKLNYSEFCKTSAISRSLIICIFLSGTNRGKVFLMYPSCWAKFHKIPIQVRLL